MFVCVIENSSFVRFCKTLLILFIFIISSATIYAFEKKRQLVPDKNGQEALRLWSEKERDRELAEALRQYWDYWASMRQRYYSAYRLWYELEQTQRWLEDSNHHFPPPPPPGMSPSPYLFHYPNSQPLGSNPNRE